MPITCRAPLQAAQLAIKSAGNVTLDNNSNSVGVLAAVLSGNAALTFVDSTGLQIGTVDSGALQVIGISDGTGTSNVSITLGGPLTQAVSAPILLHGNLSLDTSAYDAGDVTVKNSAAAGTVLDSSLIAGDFNLTSTGNVTQKAGAYLQVGGNFNVSGGGAFIEGSSPNNLIGGGSASVSGNEIKLYGVITLSTDAGTGALVASAWNGTSTTTASIASSQLASGVQVLSAAGGNSISSVNSGPAITLGEANSIGGSLKITTQGTYSNSGTAVATGINESNALHLSDASFTVQQSAANAGSAVAGAGKLDLSNSGNTFTGTVSMSAVGMEASLAAGTNINLGTVNAQNVTVSTTQNVTQAAGSTVQADTLLVQNAQNVTLNNANLVNTLAASGLTGALSLTDAQSLSVGTASAVDGIGGGGSVVLQTTTGDLVLDKAIAVSGSSDITLASAANFINNVGANALTLGTGHWQVWSTDPSLDTINGLSANFKQYNATYGTSTVLGGGNGVLYTLAPQLSVSLTGSVTRTYDADTDANLTQSNYNVAGLVGSDSVILGTSGTFDNKNVGTGKTITVNPAVVSASDGAVQVYGYQIGSGSATISGAIGHITPATISAVTGVTASNKVYDGTTSAMLDTASTVGFSGMFSGDHLTVASATGTFASPNASASPIAVNISGISLGGMDAGNYTLSSTTASTSASINPYAVSLTGTRTYDGTTTVNSGVLTLGPLVGSETLTLSGNGVASSKNVGAQTVNTSGLTLGNGTGLASNYTFAGGTQTVGITQANLTVTTSNVSKTYDGALSASGAAVASGGTQLFGSDTLSGGTYAFTNANAGTGNKTVTVGGVTVNDGNSGGNYNVSYISNTTSTINPASITVDAANVTKTYDGTLTANGTANLISGTLYHNASNGNAQDTLSGGTFAFTDPNAGTGNKIVTAGGVTVNDGNSGNNYVVTYVNNTTSTINPYAVSLTGTRTYDGTTTVNSGVLTLGPLVGSETLTLSGNGVASSKNVGAQTVNTSGLTLGNGTGLASNYTFAGGTQTVGITQANLTVTTSNVSKTYDGALSASGAAVASGGTQLFGSDTLSGGTYAFTNANAGTGNKTVTVGGVTVNDGNSGGNYNVSYISNTTSTINPASITVDAANVTKTYDGTLTANGTANLISGTLYHNASNGNAQDTLSGGTFAFTDPNAGTGNKIVTAGGVTVNDGNSGNNYVVTYVNNTTSTINPALLTFSGTIADKAYDGTTAANLSGYTLTGLIGNETLGAAATAAAFVDKNAGVGKTVNISGITLADGTNGGLASNYYMSPTATAAGTITPKVLTVNADVADKVYDGTTNATLSGFGLTGFVGNETVTGVLTGGASFADKNVGTNKGVTITGVNLLNGTNGGLASNYTVSTAANSTASITPATLHVAGVVALDKVYDGTAIADLNTQAATIAGIYGSDQVQIGSITGTYLTKDVGTNKPIGAGVVVLSGADAGNYVLVQPTGLSSSITPRLLDVSATGVNKTYDGTSAATVSLADDRIAGDSFTVTSTNNFIDPSAGTGKYISVSNIALRGADAQDYMVNGSTATYANIAKAPLTVTAVGVNKVYDGTTSAGVVLSDTPLSGDKVDVNYSSASFADKNVGNGKAVTINGITLSGAEADDYTINVVPTATANITPAALNVNGLVSTKSWDGTTSAIVILTDDRIKGDQLTVSDSSAQYQTATIGTGKIVLVDGVAISGADARNYVLVDDNFQTLGAIAGDPLNGESGTLSRQPSLPQPVPFSTTTLPRPPVDVTLPGDFGGGTGASGYSAGSSGGSGSAGSGSTNSTAGTAGTNGPSHTNGGSPSSDSASPNGGQAGTNSSAADGGVSRAAAGGANAQAQVTVSLVRNATVEDVGQVSVSVPQEVVSSGESFSFALPTTVTDGSAKVRLTLLNGKRLPSWLKYIPATRMFVATAVPGGALPLDVLVTVGARKSIVSIVERTVH